MPPRCSPPAPGSRGQNLLAPRGVEKYPERRVGCTPCSAPHPHGLFFHAWLPGELLKGRLVWPCLPSPHQLRPHKAPSANRPEETVRGRGDTEHPRLGHSLRHAWHRSHPVPKLQTWLEVLHLPGLTWARAACRTQSSGTSSGVGRAGMSAVLRRHGQGGSHHCCQPPRASVMLFRHPIPKPLLPKGPWAAHGASKSPPWGQHRAGWTGRPAGGGLESSTLHKLGPWQQHHVAQRAFLAFWLRRRNSR